MGRDNKRLQNIENRLVELGIRPTIHRIHIAQYVLFEADHPTADEVLVWAKQNLPKVSRATVYNALRDLTQAGLIREFRFPQVSKTVYDKNTKHHFHFFDQGSESFWTWMPKPSRWIFNYHPHSRLIVSIFWFQEIAQIKK